MCKLLLSFVYKMRYQNKSFWVALSCYRLLPHSKSLFPKQVSTLWINSWFSNFEREKVRERSSLIESRICSSQCMKRIVRKNGRASYFKTLFRKSFHDERATLSLKVQSPDNQHVGTMSVWKKGDRGENTSIRTELSVLCRERVWGGLQLTLHTLGATRYYDTLCGLQSIRSIHLVLQQLHVKHKFSSV